MIAKLIKKKEFGLYAHLVLEAPGLARRARPGQFVEVKITGPGAPFWRRPFSICRSRGNTIELLIKQVGQGSALLRQTPLQAPLDLLGPLGNHFEHQGKSPAVLVGGGFGVAPLLFLAETLQAKRIPMDIMIGGRCQEDLLLRKELGLTGARVACTTDDGSFGQQGLVTQLLEERLQQQTKNLTIYCAGPWPMMAAVAKLCQTYRVACQVSLEEVMACGLGVCNGCVVTVQNRYQRVCKDGPIFKGEDVTWQR